MFLVESERIRRLLRRPANPDAAKVEDVISKYRQAIDNILQGSNYRGFEFDATPADADFPVSRTFWPYYRDLKAPIGVRVDRDGSILTISTNLVAVRLIPKQFELVFRERNLTSKGLTQALLPKDNWHSRLQMATTGLELTQFVASHTPPFHEPDL